MPDSVPGRVEWDTPSYPPIAVAVGWPAARLPAVGEVITCPSTYRGAVRVRIDSVGWEVDTWTARGRPTVVYVVHGVEVSHGSA